MIPLKRTAERAFAVLVLLLFTSALIPLLYAHGGTITAADESQGDPKVQVVWAIIYLITFLLLATRWKYAVQVAARGKVLWVLVGIALASVLWSDLPGTTLRQSVALIGTTAFGVYLAARYEIGEQQRLVAWALAIAAVLSLAFALALPTYGASSGVDVPGWRGVYSQKNQLGSTMALSTLVFLFLVLTSRKRRWIAGACLLLSFGLVILSKSMSALVVCTVLLALFPVYSVLRWRITLAVPLLTGTWLLVGGVVFWILSHAEAILGTLGRNATLTGRTGVWALVLAMIRERPWLGYGYGGFWASGKGAYFSFALNGFEPTSAHNGFLDLWLQLGLLGVAVFVFTFLLALLRAAAWAHLSKSTESLWPLMYLTFMLLYSITESSIMNRNDIFWALYAATILSSLNRRDLSGSLGVEKQQSHRETTPSKNRTRISQAGARGIQRTHDQ